MAVDACTMGVARFLRIASAAALDHMTNNLTSMPDSELRTLLQQSRQVLTTLVDSLSSRPDMQEAICILMRPDDMLETFSKLAVQEPDLMWLVLHAAVAGLVNVQSVEAIEGELKRRTVKGN